MSGVDRHEAIAGEGASLAGQVGSMTAAEFLRRYQEEILGAWAERSRSLPHASQLPGLVLLDHLPELLEALAQRLEGASPLVVEASALEHAVDRSRNGVPLREVVSEYAILRDVIEDKAKLCGQTLSDAFNRAFEDAVSETMELYKRAGAEWERRSSGP
jgi:hypothetical protein